MYEFDLKALLEAVKNSRWMIVRNCFIGAVVAVVIGYSIPKVYVADSELAAELADKGSLGGSASSLAALAGIQLNGGSDAIGPNLYPNILSSNSFIAKLLNTEVETLDGNFKGTYDVYLTTQQKSPWWNLPKAWISSLVKSLFSSGDNNGVTEKKAINPEHLTAEEYNLINAVRGAVQCAVNDEDGTIMMEASAQDPMVAKMMVDAATLQLQNFITQYRTNKSRIDLEYYQQLEKEALTNYTAAREAYSLFCDSHLDLTSQAFKSERERLQNELQLAFSTYSQTQQQVNVALAKVQENTPAFTEISAATVPLFPDSPKKKMILIAILFVTLMGSLGWVYFRLMFSKGSFFNSAVKDSVEN